MGRLTLLEHAIGHSDTSVASLKSEGNKALAEADRLLADPANARRTAGERRERLVAILERAVLLYRKALEADPARTHHETPVVLANRAHARQRLATASGIWAARAHYEGCVDDCTAALELRPGYAKARFRRARANLALACRPLGEPGSERQEELLAAVRSDLLAVLDADPECAEAAEWKEAAPRLVSGFGGKRLPETLAELRREMQRLGGQSVPRARPFTRPAPRASSRAWFASMVALVAFVLVAGSAGAPTLPPDIAGGGPAHVGLRLVSNLWPPPSPPTPPIATRWWRWRGGGPGADG